jgi:hypothetical protein
MGLIVRAEAGPENENQISVIQQPSSPFRVTVVEENPTFALFGRDRHYTNGFTLALTSGQLVDDSIRNAPVRLLRAIYVFNRPSFKIAEASTKKSPWATLWPVVRYFTRTISGPVSRFCFVPMSLRNSVGLIRSELSIFYWPAERSLYSDCG